MTRTPSGIHVEREYMGNLFRLLNLCVCMLIMPIIVGWGCSVKPSPPPIKTAEELGIRKVLITPFYVIIPSKNSETAACPVSGAICRPGRIEEGAASLLSNKLFAYLKNQTDYELISPGRGDGVRQEIMVEDLGMSERALLVEMGRRLHADAVITGTLYRYQERVGNALSVESSASVGFGVHFIRIQDGRLLWSRQFDETQKSLSEDLFQLKTFVKRGGGWLSAEQLATFGLEKLMAVFPYK